MTRKLSQRFLQVVFFVFLVMSSLGCARWGRMDLSSQEARATAVDGYLAEFSTPSFMDSKIGPAIREVMMRLPEEALKKVMDRRRPVLFVEVYSSGTAKFASSSEVIVTEKDLPAFQQGMTLIKISDALAVGSSDAIMGIVAHEVAHRVLDHVRRDHVSCESERETNRLIKAWGFVKEFEAASKEFGQAKVGDGVASCREIIEAVK